MVKPMGITAEVLPRKLGERNAPRGLPFVGPVAMDCGV